LIAEYGVYLAAGKDGIGYSVNTHNLGHTQPADFGNAKANCAKLKASPIWIAASPGPVDPCPQNQTTLDFMPRGKTRHVHATPVQYMSPTRGMTIFIWGENSQLHAWTMSSTGALTYLAQGRETASVSVTNPPGGMPGGSALCRATQIRLAPRFSGARYPIPLQQISSTYGMERKGLPSKLQRWRGVYALAP
jgi:hypothetical protein